MEEFKSASYDSIFSHSTPNEITLFFFLLGLSVEQSLTIDELNSLANGLFLMAQVMFTIAAQLNTCKNKLTN
ncbi:MAG: hypothetical protein H6Q73_2043 [Firmicutes bacterium]|nr:hypothetical protein [Bacillota bacterium]